MITQFNRDHPAQNLPDAYRKDQEFNNAKILAIEKYAVDQLREIIGETYEILDIDKAFGKTLDLYGDMVGQRRGQANDDQYRILIKSKIARNHADADYNSIINAICLTFGCTPDDIIFTELDEPCKVALEGLPISKLNASNIDMRTAVQIVSGLIPVGVLLVSINFSGTFEFSGGTELVYDEEAGFGNVEQTIGGYFGLVSDSFGSNLPV